MWRVIAFAALVGCSSDGADLEPIDEFCAGKTTDCPRTWAAAQDGASWSCDAGFISFWKCSDVEEVQTAYVDSGLRFYYDVETGASIGVDEWYAFGPGLHDRDLCVTPYDLDLVRTGSGCDLQCNVLTQQSCASGSKCSWIHDTETPTPLGHIDCVPDGLASVGSACTFGSDGPNGYDNCVQGSACDVGICRQICDDRGGTPQCPSSFRCTTHAELFVMGGMLVAGVCDPSDIVSGSSEALQN